MARKKRIRKVCHDLRKFTKPSIYFNHFDFESHFSVINNHFQFCRVLKAASSFILHFDDNYPPGTFGSVTPPSTKKPLFMIVREPYGRMVSGYIDRFITFPLTWDRYGKGVIHKFRTNATAHALNCGHDVTFPEFVKYVIYSQKTRWNLDFHFAPMSVKCDPCDQNVNFDYIVHLETLEEDLSHILSTVNITERVINLDIEEGLIKNKVTHQIEQENVITKCENMCQALQKLWWTFQSRGLIPRSYAFPMTDAQCSDKSQWGKLPEMGWSVYSAFAKTIDKKKEIERTITELFLQVSLEDRLRLRHLFALDFMLYGYDSQPEHLFPELHNQ